MSLEIVAEIEKRQNSMQEKNLICRDWEKDFESKNRNCFSEGVLKKYMKALLIKEHGESEEEKRDYQQSNSL